MDAPLGPVVTEIECARLTIITIDFETAGAEPASFRCFRLAAEYARALVERKWCTQSVAAALNIRDHMRTDTGVVVADSTIEMRRARDRVLFARVHEVIAVGVDLGVERRTKRDCHEQLDVGHVWHEITVHIRRGVRVDAGRHVFHIAQKREGNENTTLHIDDVRRAVSCDVAGRC